MHANPNRIHSHLQEIDMIGKLADLKDNQLKTAVWLEALTALLIERNMLSPEDIAAKLKELDSTLPLN